MTFGVNEVKPIHEYVISNRKSISELHDVCMYFPSPSPPTYRGMSPPSLHAHAFWYGDTSCPGVFT